MSAQAMSKACKADHKTNVKACTSSNTGAALAVCLQLAQDAKAVCKGMDDSGHDSDSGSDSDSGDDSDSTGDSDSDGSTDGTGDTGGTDGGDTTPPPAPSTCDTSCQDSHDATVASCETAYDLSTCASGDTECPILVGDALRSCIGAADSTLSFCLAGCGG